MVFGGTVKAVKERRRTKRGGTRIITKINVDSVVPTEADKNQCDRNDSNSRKKS